MEVPVFTSTAGVVNDNLDGWIVSCRKRLMCPAFVQKLVLQDPSSGPCSLDFVTCLKKIIGLSKGAPTNCHLRALPEILIMKEKVTVSGAGIIAGAVRYTNKLGFLHPEKAVDTRIVDSWIADAVSYQHTPSKSSGAGTRATTFSEVLEKKLFVSQQSFECDVPSTFTTSCVGNAQGMYNMLQSDRGSVERIKLGTQISSSWLNAKKILVKKPPDELKPYLFKQDDGMYASQLTTSLQPSGVVTGDKFYNYLQVHRDARGSDAKGVSLLTSGYYLFSMTRALDQVVWQLVDILNFHRATKLDVPLCVPHGSVNNNVLAALVLNGVHVQVVTHNPQPKDCLLSYVTAIPGGSISYLPAYFGGSAPVCKKKSISGVTEAEFADRLVTFKKLPHIAFTHVYLRDYMTDVEHYIVPSIHCHAGHVMLCNYLITPIDAKGVMTVKDHFRRMSMANKYKTAFPVRRVPFFTQDVCCPAIVREGFRLNYRIFDETSSELVAEDVDLTEDLGDGECDQTPMDFVSSVIPVVSPTYSEFMDKSISVALTVVVSPPPPLVPSPLIEEDADDDEDDLEYEIET